MVGTVTSFYAQYLPVVVLLQYISPIPLTLSGMPFVHRTTSSAPQDTDTGRQIQYHVSFLTI